MSHELPRHEKICLHGLRPGRRHKTGCTATETTCNWRLEFGIKERTSTFDICTIRTAFYMECKVYKRTKTFCGPGSSLPQYKYVLIAGGKILLVIIGILQTCTAYWNRLSGMTQLVEHTSGMLKDLDSILSSGIL